MSCKTLSIIVPSYNMERFLGKCLESVLGITRVDAVEVIVVNDGSTDGTSRIGHDFEAQHPGSVIVIDKPNGNYGSCINVGLTKAKGRFVRILDADDYCDTENLSSYVDYIDNLTEDVDLVLNDYDKVDPDGRVVSSCRYGLPVEAEFGLSRLNAGNCLWPSIHAIAYRREMLIEMGYCQTEGISYTDSEWFTLPMSRVRKVRYFPKVITKYLVGRDGQTMNPETFAKNVWMLEKIAHRYAMDYPRLLKSCEPSACEFFKRRIIDHFQLIYTSVLIGCDGVRSDFDLVRFDEWLKMSMQEVYDALASRYVPAKFKFRYVKEWRKRRSRNTVLFYLFDGYLYLINLKRSVLK